MAFFTETQTFDCYESTVSPRAHTLRRQGGCEKQTGISFLLIGRGILPLMRRRVMALVEQKNDWFPSLNRTCQLLSTQDTFSSTQKHCVYTAYERRAALFRSQLSGDALVKSELTPEQHVQVQAELIKRGIFNGTADGEFRKNPSKRN